MSKTRPEWSQEITRRADDLIALRRDFHRHPELSHQERRTAEIIAERLHAAKLDVRTGVGGTGVVGVLHGDRPGPTIAWRADIDALPLTELLEAPFTSGTPGVMHACGHDGHTAIAITMADILAARRAEMSGTAVFLFQPAEEVLGGARPMIEAGALDNPRVEEIYGLHLTTQQPVGQVQVRPGPSMASADAFTVEVRGSGGHGAMPHLSVDPITAAASILLGMQALISREVPAQDTAVLTVGQIVSGTKGNIIPDSRDHAGHHPRLRAVGAGSPRRPARRLRRRYREGLPRGGDTRFDGGSCPAVVNHAKETEFVRACAVDEVGGEAVTDGRVVMASDDMSLFLRERPGCYFRVGIGSATGAARPHHAPEFEMNEAGLPVALRVGLSVMRAALAR